jgi:hypothetical protein
LNIDERNWKMVEIDLTGGYDPAFDWPLQGKPENPEMRESVSFWISDSEGRFGFPRMCIEAVADTWDNRGVEANIAFPDGRVLIGSNGYAPNPAKSVDGKIVELNAGPLSFEMLEPLKRWRMTFDGPTYESNVERSVAGQTGGPSRHVTIRVDTTAAAPAWSPGELAARSGDKSTELAMGAVGGHRHEQLFRCTGTFAVDGAAEQHFEGTGLKIRRTGVRHIGDFPGHCWMSAVFPSGKAFGIQSFPERNDGTPFYSEGFIFDGREKTYVKVVQIPWMTTFTPHGGDVDIVLQTENGQEIRIGGTTHDSTFIAAGNPMFGNWLQPEGGKPNGIPMPFHQGGARYTWDGETTFGMIERSMPTGKFQG